MSRITLAGWILLIAIVLTGILSIWLYFWTYRAWYPRTEEMQEAMSKPLRPIFRLVFSAIMIVGLFTLELFAVIRFGDRLKD